MTRVAVTYSPEVGGSSVISLKESFTHVGSEVIDGDYRKMMEDIPKEEFDKLYSTEEGRQRLFAHAKAKAMELLKDVDVLALSGNSAMIDPELFNQTRDKDQKYDLSRTIAELALVHVATEQGMPVFGVCGGHQVIAVYGGGEISDLNSDKLDKQKFMNYDAIKLNKDSMIAQIIGGKKVQEEVDAARKKFDEKIDEFNKLSKKVEALEKLNVLKNAGKIDELETSKVQALLDLTGLKVKEDLLDLQELVGELGNLDQLKDALSKVSHELNDMRQGLEDGSTTPHYESEFFGAHNQVVSKLGTGFKQTGTASDNESIEAAESEYGVPIITTQFHPEVGAKGLPNAKLLYKRTQAEQETNLDIFRYLDKAGEAYSKKKTVMDELSQFKPKETVNKEDVDITPNIKPSDVIRAIKEQQEQQRQSEHVGEKQEKESSSKQEKSSFFGKMFSAIGSAIRSAYNSVKETIKEVFGTILRDKVSKNLTGNKVSSLKKKEIEQSSSEDLGDSSFSSILRDVKSKAPSEIFRETSAQLWTKQDDDLEETIVNRTDTETDETTKVGAVQKEDMQLREDEETLRKEAGLRHFRVSSSFN